MTTAERQLLTQVLNEVRSLRRDFSLVIPMESIDEYENAAEIEAAYRAMKKEVGASRK